MQLKQQRLYSCHSGLEQQKGSTVAYASIQYACVGAVQGGPVQKTSMFKQIALVTDRLLILVSANCSGRQQTDSNRQIHQLAGLQAPSEVFDRPAACMQLLGQQLQPCYSLPITLRWRRFPDTVQTLRCSPRHRHFRSVSRQVTICVPECSSAFMCLTMLTVVISTAGLMSQCHSCAVHLREAGACADIHQRHAATLDTETV